MKKIAYLWTLVTMVVFLGCNKNSESSASGSADTTTSTTTSSAGNDNRRETARPTDPVASDNTANPDNTGKNVRDRSDSTMTPGDQGQNQQELEVTRRIRRAITSNDQLSQEAKNIKIITANGKVTLRGPVNSDQERQTIESIAKQIEGVTVDDQLEVKGRN